MSLCNFHTWVLCLSLKSCMEQVCLFLKRPALSILDSVVLCPLHPLFTSLTHHSLNYLTLGMCSRDLPTLTALLWSNNSLKSWLPLLYNIFALGPQKNTNSNFITLSNSRSYKKASWQKWYSGKVICEGLSNLVIYQNHLKRFLKGQVPWVSAQNCKAGVWTQGFSYE